MKPTQTVAHHSCNLRNSNLHYANEEDSHLPRKQPAEYPVPEPWGKPNTHNSRRAPRSGLPYRI